jgi:hypothetical protein
VAADIGSRKLEDRIAMPDRLSDTPRELSYELSSLKKGMTGMILKKNVRLRFGSRSDAQHHHD